MGRWIRKKPEYEPIIRDIHILFQKGESYSKICEYINREYSQVLSEQLKPSQVKSILTDPVYIGRPRYRDVVVEDPNLRFIDDETFKKTQKILEKRSKKRKGEKIVEIVDVESLVRKYGVYYTGKLLHIAVICENCGTPTVKNGIRQVKGIYRNNYLCPKCGKQQLVPTAHQLEHFKSAKPFYCMNCGTPDDFEERKIGEWFRVRCRVCGYEFDTDRSVNKFLRFTKKKKKPRKFFFDRNQGRLDDFV